MGLKEIIVKTPPPSGQDSIESLLGHIGTNDVADVKDGIEQCLRSRNELNPRKVDISRFGVNVVLRFVPHPYRIKVRF